jgi:hypothetical protein
MEDVIDASAANQSNTSVVVFDDIDFLIKMVKNNDKERNDAPQLPT